jgi:hypothetical protein
MIKKKSGSKAGRKAIALKRFELWRSPKGRYTFFPEDNASARSTLSPDARKVKIIRAKNWDEAQAKKHEYLGLEPYKPMK